MGLQTPDELKTALRNAVKATEGKPHYFALLLKGGDGLLIVDKRKIPSATIDAARKKAGSSAVVRGICFGSEDSTVFQALRSPGGNVVSTIKKAAQAQAGLSIRPELHIGAADDGEDKAETQEAPPNETPSRAIIEIQAVVKNLTAEPKTLGQVLDLQRSLGTDEVVEDVCDLIDDIRTPLYEALEDLRSHLAA